MDTGNQKDGSCYFIWISALRRDWRKKRTWNPSHGPGLLIGLRWGLDNGLVLADYLKVPSIPSKHTRDRGGNLFKDPSLYFKPPFVNELGVQGISKNSWPKP